MTLVRDLLGGGTTAGSFAPRLWTNENGRGRSESVAVVMAAVGAGGSRVTLLPCTEVRGGSTRQSYYPIPLHGGAGEWQRPKARTRSGHAQSR